MQQIAAKMTQIIIYNLKLSFPEMMSHHIESLCFLRSFAPLYKNLCARALYMWLSVSHNLSRNSKSKLDKKNILIVTYLCLLDAFRFYCPDW